MSEISDLAKNIFSDNQKLVIKIDKLLKQNGLITPITKRLLLSALANPSKENIISLYRYAKPLLDAVKNSTSPFPKPNIDDDIDGATKLGKTETGLPCGLNTDDQHCLISGLTGCGKTVLLVYVILAQLLQKEEQ